MVSTGGQIVLDLSTFNKSEDCIHYIKENINLQVLFRNDDNDDRDYYISKPNGWCIFNHIVAIEFNQDDDWSQVPQQTSFPVLKNLEDKNNFVSVMREHHRQIKTSVQE
jgi:hypothetical protein